jgi:hypothetical protein
VATRLPTELNPLEAAVRPTGPVDDDAAVALLREQVPEFEDHYRDLLDIYDDDLTAPIVFMELSDFVADLLFGPEREALLERSLNLVEQVAASSGEGRQLIADAFLGELPPLTRERVRTLLGPVCEELLGRAELRL